MSTRSLRHWLSAPRVTPPTLESLKLPVLTPIRIARQRISSTSHFIVPPKRPNPLFSLWVTFMLKSSLRMLLTFLISLTTSRMLTALWVARGSLPSAREGRSTAYLLANRRTTGIPVVDPPLVLPLPRWETIYSLVVSLFSSTRKASLSVLKRLGYLLNAPSGVRTENRSFASLSKPPYLSPRGRSVPNISSREKNLVLMLSIFLLTPLASGRIPPGRAPSAPSNSWTRRHPLSWVAWVT